MNIVNLKNHTYDIPLISIIAVCHNHSAFVLETLESIRLQTYPNIELIIINNLKDECEFIISEWIESHKLNCIFIQNEKAKNVSQNFNLGLSLLHGKYFQCISCDDILMTDKLSKQVEVYEKNKNIGLLYGKHIKFYDNNEVNINRQINFKTIKVIHSQDMLQKLVAGRIRFSAPSILYKTQIVKNVGWFDENYIMEDLPLHLKIVKNYSVIFIDEFFVYYRRSQSSITISMLNELLKSELLVIKKYKNVATFKIGIKNIISRMIILNYKKRNYISLVNLVILNPITTFELFILKFKLF